MKKKTTLALLACLALCVILAGCRRSTVAQLGDALDNWQVGANETAIEAEDIVYHDSPADVSDAVAFTITAWPDNSALELDTVCTASSFAQLDYFAGDERRVALRVAPQDAKGLLASYREGHHAAQPATITVDGTEVALKAGDTGCALAYWTKDGFQYALHANRLNAPLTEEEIAQFVRTMAAAMA